MLEAKAYTLVYVQMFCNPELDIKFFHVPVNCSLACLHKRVAW